jgi:hypothetical protein
MRRLSVASTELDASDGLERVVQTMSELMLDTAAKTASLKSDCLGRRGLPIDPRSLRAAGRVEMASLPSERGADRHHSALCQRGTAPEPKGSGCTDRAASGLPHLCHARTRRRGAEPFVLTRPLASRRISGRFPRRITRAGSTFVPRSTSGAWSASSTMHSGRVRSLSNRPPTRELLRESSFGGRSSFVSARN